MHVIHTHSQFERNNNNDSCFICVRPTQDGRPGLAKYGTTAEIYEYQEEDYSQTMSIKAKGRQRFKVISTHREITGLVLQTEKWGMLDWPKFGHIVVYTSGVYTVHDIFNSIIPWCFKILELKKSKNQSTFLCTFSKETSSNRQYSYFHWLVK